MTIAPVDFRGSLRLCDLCASAIFALADRAGNPALLLEPHNKWDDSRGSWSRPCSRSLFVPRRIRNRAHPRCSHARASFCSAPARPTPTEGSPKPRKQVAGLTARGAPRPPYCFGKKPTTMRSERNPSVNSLQLVQRLVRSTSHPWTLRCAGSESRPFPIYPETPRAIPAIGP